MTVLRAGLLDGRVVALAGGSSEQFAEALSSLGATVVRDSAEPRALHGLVYDAQVAFGSGGSGALRTALEDAWEAICVVANTSLIPEGSGGKVVLIGPRRDAGPFAAAARAGLENLARTLSVEWARYGITTTMIAPAARTTDTELAELVCFLLSEAGEYFSGCRLELGAIGD